MLMAGLGRERTGRFRAVLVKQLPFTWGQMPSTGIDPRRRYAASFGRSKTDVRERQALQLAEGRFS